MTINTVRHLGFLKFQICNSRKGQEDRTASTYQILSKLLKPRPKYGKFLFNKIFLMAAAAILYFWNYKFLMVGRIMSIELRHRAKFCDDLSNRCRDIKFLDLSRWRPPPAAAIFDLIFFTFFTVGTVKKVELCHCAKVHWNRSNHRRNKWIFRSFKMAAAAILEFWNVKF